MFTFANEYHALCVTKEIINDAEYTYICYKGYRIDSVLWHIRVTHLINKSVCSQSIIRCSKVYRDNAMERFYRKINTQVPHLLSCYPDWRC